MNLSFETWKNEDVESLVIHANNPEVSKCLRDSFPFPYTRGNALTWIRINETKVPPLNFAIHLDQVCAGGVGLVPKEDVYRKNGEIGYWLGQPFWNQGIITRAIAFITEYAFSNFDLIRLYAEVFSNNPASMRALEKNGFHREAIIPRSILKRGEILDAHVWARYK